LIEQASRLSQVCRRETFGEAAVNRPQQRARLRNPLLVSPKPREARGGAQFPGQGSLPARPVERLPEVVLGRRRASGLTLQQQKLAFDPQQLGNYPAFFAVLGADDRLLDRGVPVGDLPGTTRGRCYDERYQPRCVPGCARFGEGVAQKP
jgi:hypothetical protein